MADRSTILEADHPERGRLFAAVDGSARYVSPALAALRFAALLTPYPDAATALAALKEAGASPIDGGRK